MAREQTIRDRQIERKRERERERKGGREGETWALIAL